MRLHSRVSLLPTATPQTQLHIFLQITVNYRETMASDAGKQGKGEEAGSSKQEEASQCPICAFIEAGPCKEPHQVRSGWLKSGLWGRKGMGDCRQPTWCMLWTFEACA